MAKDQQFPNPEGTFPFFSLMYINVTQFGLGLTDHKHINHSMQNDIKINKSDIVVVIRIYKIKLHASRIFYFFYLFDCVLCAHLSTFKNTLNLKQNMNYGSTNFHRFFFAMRN